mmetsp:Transcript_98422/g.284037  ORF Transcript_98422/g.284037 Transcript_98422/m.284037 type:complete len:212 (-) Transcript_98422:91-726(-)
MGRSTATFRDLPAHTATQPAAPSTTACGAPPSPASYPRCRATTRCRCRGGACPPTWKAPEAPPAWPRRSCCTHTCESRRRSSLSTPSRCPPCTGPIPTSWRTARSHSRQPPNPCATRSRSAMRCPRRHESKRGPRSWRGPASMCCRACKGCCPSRCTRRPPCAVVGRRWHSATSPRALRLRSCPNRRGSEPSPRKHPRCRCQRGRSHPTAP